MFQPRIKYPTVSDYVFDAYRGAIQPGQWVEFEGIKGRFARASDGLLVTFYNGSSMHNLAAFSRACKGPASAELITTEAKPNGQP